MNSIFESRSDYMTQTISTPLHMVCPSCTGYWGRAELVHLDTCPTPTWRYDSRIDKCVGHHTCMA